MTINLFPAGSRTPNYAHAEPHPDGKYRAANDDDTIVHDFNTKSGAIKGARKLAKEHNQRFMIFAPSGIWIATAKKPKPKTLVIRDDGTEDLAKLMKL
jgi:hypothetical protein